MRGKIHRWLTLVSLIVMLGALGAAENGVIDLLLGLIISLAAVASFGANAYWGGLMYSSPRRWRIW